MARNYKIFASHVSVGVTVPMQRYTSVEGCTQCSRSRGSVQLIARHEVAGVTILAAAPSLVMSLIISQVSLFTWLDILLSKPHQHSPGLDKFVRESILKLHHCSPPYHHHFPININFPRTIIRAIFSFDLSRGLLWMCGKNEMRAQSPLTRRYFCYV